MVLLSVFERFSLRIITFTLDFTRDLDFSHPNPWFQRKKKQNEKKQLHIYKKRSSDLLKSSKLRSISVSVSVDENYS